MLCSGPNLAASQIWRTYSWRILNLTTVISCNLKDIFQYFFSETALIDGSLFWNSFPWRKARSRSFSLCSLGASTKATVGPGEQSFPERKQRVYIPLKINSACKMNLPVWGQRAYFQRQSFLCWKGVVSLAKDIKVMSLYWPSLNLWNWDVWCVYKTFGFYAWQENLVARHHVATLCMLGYDVRWLFKRTATEDLRSHWIYIPQNEPSGCPPIWEVT